MAVGGGVKRSEVRSLNYSLENLAVCIYITEMKLGLLGVVVFSPFNGSVCLNGQISGEVGLPVLSLLLKGI